VVEKGGGAWAVVGVGSVRWFACAGCAYECEMRSVEANPQLRANLGSAAVTWGTTPHTHDDGCLVPLARAAEEASRG